jgi:1,4-dihydroxy-6-naphthoate synthase
MPENFIIPSPVGTNRPTLSLAHSADADDVFMWWPITGKLDPSTPNRLLSPPPLDSGRFAFRAIPEDIQVLNRRAIESADLDITALSMHGWLHVKDRYTLSRCGWSLGDDWGPKLVVPTASPLDPASLRGKPIAVPGLQTTAFLVLSLMLGPGSFTPVPMRFDQIVPAVNRGEVSAGVLIHERQLDFQRQGLRALADLGVWWKSQTGLPLPLGANVIRRDLDARFGPGTLAEVSRTLRHSIEYALAHRDEALAYARTFSPDLTPEELDRYVRIYVSPLTVDCGERGLAAVRELFARAHAAGLCPDPGAIDAI